MTLLLLARALTLVALVAFVLLFVQLAFTSLTSPAVPQGTAGAPSEGHRFRRHDTRKSDAPSGLFENTTPTSPFHSGPIPVARGASVVRSCDQLPPKSDGGAREE